MADNTLDINSWITADLAKNPGLAIDVNNSSEPHIASDVIGLSHKVILANDTINDHIADNNTQGFWGKVGHGILTGLNFLGKPLQEVQRDYRFLHSVYADHGLIPGLLASAGVVAGGVVGSFVGPAGTVLGAEAAAFGMRKILGEKYKDSYKKSEDPNYKVSVGRDFSNGFSFAADKLGFDGVSRALKTTDKGLSTPGSFISGITDAAFDIGADPVMVLGRANQLIKSGKYIKATQVEVAATKSFELQAKYPLTRVIPGVQNWLLSHSGRVFSPEQIDLVRDGGSLNSVSRSYNNALEDIANISRSTKDKTAAAGEIAFKYPQLGTAAAGRLANLKTADDVHEFMKNTLFFGELRDNLNGSAILPSRTLLRKGLEPVVDKMRSSNSKIYKTFSGYMPFSVDPLTQKLSLNEFRWNSPDATSVIYRIARFGMGHKAAMEYAGQYAMAVATKDLALAKSIKSDTVYRSFLAMGLPEDNILVTAVKDEIEKLDLPRQGSGIYGSAAHERGTDISNFETPNGTRNAAIDDWQASDMLSIPNFLAAKNAVREAGLFTKYVGKTDEFIANYYTNKIFKPLALATLGFGIRVAASELIPTFARYGILNTIKARINVSRAKRIDGITSQEADNIAEASLVALGAAKGIDEKSLTEGFPTFKDAEKMGLKNAASMTPNEQIDLSIRLLRRHNGSVLSDAVSTSQGGTASDAYDLNNAAHSFFQNESRKVQYRASGDGEFTTYQADSPHYLPQYATGLMHAKSSALGKNVAQDVVDVFGKLKKVQNLNEIGKEKQYSIFMTKRQELIDRELDRMKASINGEYKPYERGQSILQRWVDQNHQEFAADRVDMYLGMYIGRDGTVLHDVAKSVAEGKTVDPEILKAIPNQSLPGNVPGKLLEPYIGNKGLFAKVIDIGFKKMIDPVINGLSREPLYLMHVADEYQSFKYAISKGFVDEEQALRYAEHRATMAMLPQIHNTSLRNQFSQLARNFMPFYFAQEQALKRAYRTLKDTSIGSPLFSRGLRFYQMSEQAINDPAFVTVDNNGNRYINLPLVGEFGKGAQAILNHLGMPMVSGLPLTAQGSLVSLKSVLPELNFPGMAPFVAVSANAISDIFPESQSVISKVAGMSYNRGFWDTVNPSATIKNLWAAINLDEQTSAVSNAMMGALSAAYYHQDTIPIPGPSSSVQERQAFIDRIKNNARSILLIKASLNMLSPLAPKVEQTDPGLRDEFFKLVKKTGNYSDALMEFLGKHGDNAISYTISKTTPAVIGAKFPYTKKAIDFIDSNKTQDFMNDSKTSSAIMFLVPQDPGNGDSMAIHQELLRQHIRSTRTPMDFMNQFYIAAGDNIMSPLMKEHADKVSKLKSMGDTYGLKLETDSWSNVMKKMENLHPIWYADYTNAEGRNNAKLVYDQLNTIFSLPLDKQPSGEQVNLVKDLMKDYSIYRNNLNTYNQLNSSWAMNIEKQNWESHLSKVKEQDPRLAPVINSVFAKLG